MEYICCTSGYMQLSSEDLQRFNVLPLGAFQCIVQAAIAIGRFAIQFVRVQDVLVFCNNKRQVK